MTRSAAARGGDASDPAADRLDGAAPGGAPLTVVVHRRVREGCAAAFEDAMRAFVAWSLAFPGHRAISMLRPPPGGTTYTVLDQFEDAAARRSFTASSGYREWMERLRELSDGDPLIREQTGLEGWLTVPGETGLAPPPKIRQAIATFLGVFPVATVLSATVAPRLEPLPFLLRAAVFNALVVSLLTWLVMPAIARLLHPWLHPERP